MCSTSLVEWATVGAEILVAAVIFYEVEEHRASTFMTDVQDKDFYEKRAALYDAYARLAGSTLKERAEAFRKKLWGDKGLRELCDSQWTYFNRLRYMLRRSLHRRLLAKWFPQVMVSFWVMTAIYVRERQQLRPTPIHNYGVVAVRESLKELKKHGFKPLTIYSNDGQARVEVSVAELENMLADVDAPFK